MRVGIGSGGGNAGQPGGSLRGPADGILHLLIVMNYTHRTRKKLDPYRGSSWCSFDLVPALSLNAGATASPLDFIIAHML